jgi:ankyrin repeat protein
MTLAEAASRGDLELLRALLDAGGDPNEAEAEEWMSPLMEAAAGNHVQAVRMLLDAGADIHVTRQGGANPLLLAIESGKMEVCELLHERGLQIDPANDYLGCAFASVAGKGSLAAVQWLLSQSVPVDITGFSGGTALIRAAAHDHPAVVEALLRAGADPNRRDNDTETALMWAADHAGNAEVLRALVHAGAAVDLRNDLGHTALTWTMLHGDPEMIRVLLDAGATIQANDLTVAARKGLIAAVRLLLERGADASDVANLEAARNFGHRDVANLLRQAREDQRLRATGETYPIRRYAIGTAVRSVTGTPREGWIVFIEWNDKHHRYGYYIEVKATTQPRKTESKRYWEDDLLPAEGDSEQTT